MKDPYDILGVARNASADDIRKAYRKLAKTLHPDLNPGDKTAEARFKEASAAYDLLSDAAKRARFDAGEIDASGAERPRQHFYRDFAGGADADQRYYTGSGFADFGAADDILSELFARAGRRRLRGGDLHFRLRVDFLAAVNGASERVTLPDGRTVDVTIPAGIEEGQTLRLKGKGEPAPEGGEAGDALVEISIAPHALFERRGNDILLELPITLSEAVLGGRVKTPTPTGAVMLTVPPSSNTGAVLRLKGRGVRAGASAGDQLVKLKIMLPSKPDADLEAFAAAWSGKDYDPRKDWS